MHRNAFYLLAALLLNAPAFGDDTPNLPLCEKLNRHDGVSCSLFRFTRSGVTTPAMRLHYAAVASATEVAAEESLATVEWCGAALDSQRADFLVIHTFEKEVSISVTTCGEYVAR